MGDLATYDEIGAGYTACRVPDCRWIARIHAAVQGGDSLVNVGAGAGSYEPERMSVVAVEPSPTMLAQRSRSAAPAVRARAELLPFADEAFDVALAVLTVHHWADAAAGLAEMRRVSRRQVVVTWDPDVFACAFWLVRDYLPAACERETHLATFDFVSANLDSTDIEVLPVPADCTDGFFGAYWRRPDAYLSANVRGAISGLALLDRGLVSAAMATLETDIATGRWSARYSDLLDLLEIDLGYRIVIAQ